MLSLRIRSCGSQDYDLRPLQYGKLDHEGRTGKPPLELGLSLAGSHLSELGFLRQNPIRLV